MKFQKITILLGVVFLMALIVLSCKKEEDEPQPQASSCTDGIQNGNETGIDCGGDCGPCNFSDPGWTTIAEDDASDAQNNGLEANRIGFQYDAANDKVKFKIYTTNLGSFSSGPAADFSFGLPNGTENNDPPGFHWVDAGQLTPVHRTAYIYTDPGGSPPSSYTYNMQMEGAQNRIALTSSDMALCSNCIGIEVDVAKNWIIYTIDRTHIITDAEMSNSQAEIKLVANVGHNLGWDDNVSLTGTFTLNMQGGSAPIVTTAAITNVTNTSAMSGGNVTDDGGSVVSARGVCYSTTTGPTIANQTVSAGSGPGGFVASLEGLSNNTTYYVRAYATNSDGTAYGNELNFTTSNAPGMATVSTSPIHDITDFSAKGGGNVTDDGGTIVTHRGLVYSTQPSPSVHDNMVVSGSGTGVFTTNLSGLESYTIYYVRAFATNSTGTSYGNEVNFTTHGLAVLTTDATIILSETSAQINASVIDDGGSNVFERGVCYSTSPNPTLFNSFVKPSGSGEGTYSTNVNGLSSGTKYYVRAYATNDVGTVYGNELSFFTIVLGMNYAGGIIIDIHPNGENGIVVAVDNQDDWIQWMEGSSSYIGNTSTVIGSGYDNTYNIVAAVGSLAPAATACWTLGLNGYNDWFLPSKDELNIMYEQRELVPNIIPNSGYWSSTEQGVNNAWVQNMTVGTSQAVAKNNNNRLRAMRYF